MKNAFRSELKNKDQILKERRKKEKILDYQKHRRVENLKKKSKFSGRGGGGPSRGGRGKGKARR